MPRAGTAERRRLRAGLPGVVKPGRLSWVHGTKLPFFQAHKDEYLAASEVKKTAAFYDNMVHLFTAKYGWSLDWNEDLEEDQDIADDADPDEDVNSLSGEETERRAQFVKQLRKKICSWYQSQFGQSRRRSKDKMGFREIFNQPALNPPAPIKPRVLHFYTRKFYHERIKARVETRWQAVSQLENPPAIIAVRNAVIKHCWLNETPEFRAEVEEARETEFQAAKEAYKVASSGETPTTPEQYNIALNNAGYYLQPFADAAHERYGMNVAIFLCGPVPEHGGRIEVRSVHAGTTNGVVPKTWAEFDRAGFDAAQRSMVEFAHRCFTPEECRARALCTDVTNGQTTTATAPSTNLPPAPAVAGGDVQPPTDDPPAANIRGTDNPVPLGTQFDLDFDLDLDLGLAMPPDGTWNGARNDVADDTLAGALDQALATLTPDERRALENMPNLTQDEADLLLAGLCNPAAWPYKENAGRATVKTGRALMKELAAMPDEARALYENRLSGLSTAELHDENTAAEERRILRRMSEGMSVEDAAAASDAEEDGGVQSGVNGNEENNQGVDDVSPPPPPPQTDDPPPPPPDVSPPPPPPQTDEVSPPPPPPVTTPPPPPQTDEVSPPPPPPPPPPPQPDKVSPPPATVSSSRPKPRPTNAGAAGKKNATKSVDGVWAGEGTAEWSTELRRAVPGLARGKEWGGKCWEECVRGVIALDRAWDFPEKGVVTMPTGSERPEEIEGWMKRARKWDVPFELKSTVGPKTVAGSFAERWWGWWGVAQPAGRIGATGEWGTIEDVGEDAWDELAKMHGRNGVLMFAAGLLWWGEAAAKDDGNAETLLTDWRLAVVDLTKVLAAVLKRVSPVKAAYERGEDGKGWVLVKTKGTKRKGGADKENDSTVPAKKRG